MRLRLTILLLLILATLTGAASERSDIDRFIASTLRAFPELPGVSVAVVKDGKPFLAAGYGFADVAAKRGMTATTPVYIASSTKSFTGLLCTMLAAEGKLDLDEPIVAYFPELDSWPDAHRITTRMLLTHSAGIRNDAIGLRTSYTGEYTPAELIRLLASSKTIEPKFRYDNLGYVAAALVAERVTGEKWQDLLARKVFGPLRMKNTTAYMTRVRGLAVSYRTSPAGTLEPLSNQKTDATMNPAGGMVTTAADLQRWLAASIAEPSAPYLEAHKQQVAVPDINYYKFRRYGYALGWYWSEYEGKLLMHAFGDYEGWHSHVSFMPKSRIGVAVIANSSGTMSKEPAQMIATYIYDRLLGRPDLEAVYAARTDETRKTLDERLRRIAADVEQRSKRPPSLTREAASYTGRYVNPQFGTLSIVNDNGAFRATIGLLNAKLEPFTAPDSARVELIPGSGEVFRFRFGESSQATAVDWSGDLFTRVP